MAAAIPFSAEIELLLVKLAKGEPITRGERELMHRKIDEAPVVDRDDDDDVHDEVGGVVLSPEDEAELKRVIAENDEDERAGRGIPWEQFLAERAARRAG
jgi:hypothetical protein